MKNDQILYKKTFLEILICKTKAMIRFTHVICKLQTITQHSYRLKYFNKIYCYQYYYCYHATITIKRIQYLNKILLHLKLKGFISTC